jgi:hypothetical protein
VFAKSWHEVTALQDTINLREGKLVVFTHGRSPYFQCRIKFPRTPYVYKLLSTRDRNEAVRLAEDFFAESKFKHENGLNISPRSFKNVAEAYLEHLRVMVDGGRVPEKKLNDQRKVIERYFVPYFGKKLIDTITDADVYRCQDWRETYWTTGPGAGTTVITYQRRGRPIPASRRAAP